MPSVQELFDALGLLREQELTLSAKSYGIDDLYFTNAVDYGYSRSLAEAARSFDTAAVLREMVEIIRLNQPVVVISRWYGGAQDGHGQHQMAGALVPLAVAAAADSTRYPEQLLRLRPWRVRRLYRSNTPAGGLPHLVVHSYLPDPWLGESPRSLGATGLALQRSQTSGRRRLADGVVPERMERVDSSATSPTTDPFEHLDTSIPGLFGLAGEPSPDGAPALLAVVESAGRMSLDSMRPDDPQAIVPQLARGLAALRTLADLAGPTLPNARQLLAVKIAQFERAIATAIGLEVRAIASPVTSDRVVPGDTFTVDVSIRHASSARVQVLRPPASIDTRDTAWAQPGTALLDPYVTHRIERRIVAGTTRTALSRPRFSRSGLTQNHYDYPRITTLGEEQGTPAIKVELMLAVGDAYLRVKRSVRHAAPTDLDGETWPLLPVVPPVTLHVEPSVRVVTGTGDRRVQVNVRVSGNTRGVINAAVQLSANDRRVTTPREVRVGRGDVTTVPFEVTLPAGSDSITLTASALIETMRWSDDVTESVHRDIEPTRLYTKPTVTIRRVPVLVRPGLRVGYIMGVGDLVPDAIRQLGATLTMLDSTQLSSGTLPALDAIVIGTRAYAVRQDLVRATPALLAWARRGGHLVVLYQTQEFKPERQAPFHALLPDDAEEVTEQDAVVTVVAPNDAMLQSPNRITTRDFDGWIEQRGSKFLTDLAPQYTSLIETHDTGMAPQRGIWVTATTGRGRWSYVALALHRQLPYGVPGAYRILANVLSQPRQR